MRIAVLGAGAMGMLFGGYLSKQNDVCLVEVNTDRVNKINADGILVHNETEDIRFYPRAISDTTQMEPVDLILVFVKAMHTVSALEANRTLIGDNTYIMTLQNGAGHETKLLRFTDKAHVIIGTTQHNSSIAANGEICHGGNGLTTIGLLEGDCERLTPIAESFTACGIPCTTAKDVKRQIWKKLFTNTAASALTAVLQVPLGYLCENRDARYIMYKLCEEAVRVANAEGYACFNTVEVQNEVEQVCRNARNGYTSIYADIRDGHRTEVDTISGSVIDAAKALGIPVPYHEMLVHLIHAMEQRQMCEKKEKGYV